MSAPTPCLDVFRLESILLDLPTGSKDEILASLVDHAIRSKGLPRTRRDEVLDHLVEREARGSTAIGKGLAIPHARIEGLKKGTGIVARSIEGVDFRAVDGEPVYAFVLLISPDHRADEHLATLRWISKVARDPDFLSFIRQARRPEDVLEVLRERAP